MLVRRCETGMAGSHYRGCPRVNGCTQGRGGEYAGLTIDEVHAMWTLLSQHGLHVFLPAVGSASAGGDTLILDSKCDEQGITGQARRGMMPRKSCYL